MRDTVRATQQGRGVVRCRRGRVWPWTGKMGCNVGGGRARTSPVLPRSSRAPILPLSIGTSTFCFFLHKTIFILKFCMGMHLYIIYAFIFLVSFFVHIFFQSGPCLCVGPERLVEEPRALCSLHASNACLGLSYAAGLTVSLSPSKHARGPCWPRSVRPKILPTFRKSYLSSILR